MHNMPGQEVTELRTHSIVIWQANSYQKKEKKCEIAVFSHETKYLIFR